VSARERANALLGLSFPLEVRYAYPDAGYPAECERVARQLSLGTVYTIQALEVGQSSTYITLWGHPRHERFPLQMFAPHWLPDDDEPESLDSGQATP